MEVRGQASRCLQLNGIRDGLSAGGIRGAVEADDLAVEHRVVDDVAHEARVLGGVAEAGRVRHLLLQDVAGLPRQAGEHRRLEGSGAIVMTRIALSAKSRAADKVSPAMPALLAAYAAWPIWPSKAAMLAVLTMTPRSPSSGSLSSMAAAARRSTLNEPTRLMSTTVLNVSSASGPWRADDPTQRSDPGTVDGDADLADRLGAVDRRLHLRLVADIGGTKAACPHAELLDERRARGSRGR